MKQIVAFGTNGQISHASIEDIISARKNSFRGWTCNAGVQNLYIDFDGRVWIANCAGSKQKMLDSETAWGYLGEAGTHFNLPNAPVICPYAQCGCGSDVIITKHSNRHPVQPDLFTWQYMRENTPLLNSSELIGLRTNYPLSKQILWDIGRFCNYDCSYCWPDVHNKTDKHKTLDVFVDTADYLIRNWSEGHQIRWYFGGGEPTLNPNFESFVEYLSARNQWVMLVSNGSQGTSYWEKHAKNYNTLIFSAHFEFMKPELFIRNYSRVVETMIAGAAKPEKFIVKLMTKAGELQNSKDFIERLKDSCDYDKVKHRLDFDIVPLRGKGADSDSVKAEYSADELVQIIKINRT